MHYTQCIIHDVFKTSPSLVKFDPSCRLIKSDRKLHTYPNDYSCSPSSQDRNSLCLPPTILILTQTPPFPKTLPPHIHLNLV